MKRYGYAVVVLACGLLLAGCGKKQQSLEEMQQPMSPEDLSRLSTEIKAVPETRSVEPAPAATGMGAQAPIASVAEPQIKLENLPPQGPYKPTGLEIQTALKNAGFYTGTVDGKLGPLTKKAIEEFQKANNLTVDGKVGPKTWNVLSTHLKPPQPAVTSKKKKR
jgi:hypothetical protein